MKNLSEIHKYEYGMKNIDLAIENKKEKNYNLRKYYCDIYSKNINKYDESFSEFIDKFGVYALNNNDFVIELGIIAKLLMTKKGHLKDFLLSNFKKIKIISNLNKLKVVVKVKVEIIQKMLC